MLFGLLGFLYIAYLDLLVRRQFEGKRWSLPARVYAQPLELYAGLSLRPTQLADHLNRLGYRKTSRVERPGSYRLSGDVVELATRPFEFWDSVEVSRRVRLEFSDTRLVGLRDPQGGRPGLVRLDPQEIAGIYPAQREDRVLVRRDQLPDLLVQALLAVEDRKFFQHHGVDPEGIARALFANLRAGRTVQGGSTLTQQLVKNFFLSSERTLKRKINEVLMALLVEWHYGKDEILEAYANEVYAGQDGDRAIHGFGLASQFYFGRPLAELSAEQIATLVGLLKGPSYYDPRRNPERAKARRNLVLTVMAEQGFLNATQVDQLMQRPLGVSRRTRGVTPYPAFLDLVRRQLARDYRDEDLTSEGLRIFTTLNVALQRSVEQALGGGIPILERRHGLVAGTLQGAAVFSDAQTGEVLALVGDRDPRGVGFNRALDARRPIGSLIKPFIYLQALSEPARYDLVTLLADEPLTVPRPGNSDWTPQNYDRKYHGMVPLRNALAYSYNVATVALGLELGVDRVVTALQRYGIRQKLQAYPSLLLGTLELSPFEMAELYQVLSSGGFRTPLRAIRAVTTGDGEPLQRYPLEVEPVAEPGPVYLTTRAMQDVVKWGTGRSLLEKVPRSWQLAGKTGTSGGLRDSWFAAFSADVLGVVWLGRDDNKPTRLSGATGALRVFGDAIAGLSLASLEPPVPAGIDWRWVNNDTGKASAQGCTGAERLPFLAGSPPLAPGDCGGRDSVPGDSGNDKENDSWFGRWFR